MTIEENLRKLKNVLQTERPAMGGAEAAEPLRVTNPVTGENTLIALRRNEWEQGRTARQALKSDLRFEYLKKPEDQIAEFIANCVFQPNERNVDNFIAAHAREPVTRICYFTVENLKVETPLEILGLTLLPVDDESLPPPEILNDPRAPAGSVVRVEVTGTDVSRMVQRARDEANHALRRMRIAFRKERALNERQLRFRLGTTFAFDSGDAAGIYTREDVAYGLVANQYLADLATVHPIAAAPATPVTDIDRRIDVAMRWMERATFEPDRLLGILFLFFALESLIGEKSGELKAGALSFRQMMLSHLVDGNFTNPITTFDLYQVTRSDTVHGETISEVEDAEHTQFRMTMHRTLEQYIAITLREGFTKRRQLRRYLDEHTDRTLLINWVKTRGALPQFEKQFRDLVEYVESLEKPSPEE